MRTMKYTPYRLRIRVLYMQEECPPLRRNYCVQMLLPNINPELLRGNRQEKRRKKEGDWVSRVIRA